MSWWMSPLLLIFLLPVHVKMMAGGIGNVNEATPEIQTIVDGLKADAQAQSGKEYAQFKAISYKAQVVAGTNYFVKVQVSDTEYIHIRVFQPLPYENAPPKLVSLQDGKTQEDEIQYF